MTLEQKIERLARAMAGGDPDRLVPVSYRRVIGRSDGNGIPVALQTDTLPAWRFYLAEARAALSRDPL